MATIVDRIIIDTSQGVKSVENLDRAFWNYNRRLIQGRQIQWQYSVSAQGANAIIAQQRREMELAQRTIAQTTARMNVLNTLLSQMKSIVIFAVGYRLFFGLTSAITASIGAAKELSISIAEIRTISQDAAIETEQWNTALRTLADQFGVDAVEQAEAAYQTLSNQIKGLRGETLELARIQGFLREQNKLAAISQATVAQTVAVTTSALNGYQMSVEQTSRINAILFKTVELGRLRLGELSETLGRINVVSNQLGISFEEQQAALTTLTRQGVKAAEAITLLRNLELKLIKPSERLESIFAEWGVSSGEAAIRTFGFVEVLRKLAEEAKSAGDFSAEAGEIFNRLRAVVGFSGLTSAFDGFEEDLASFVDAGEKSAAAFEEVFNSTGQRVNRQLGQLRNSIELQFGEPLLKFFLETVEGAGGARKAFLDMLSVGFKVLSFYAAYRVSAGLATLAVNAFLAAQNFAAVQRLTLFGGAVGLVAERMTSLAVRTTLVSTAVAALAAAYIQHRFAVGNLEGSYKALTQTITSTFQQETAVGINNFFATIDDAFTAQQMTLRASERALNEYVSASRVNLNELDDAYAEAFTDLTDQMVEPVERALGRMEDRVKQTVRVINKETGQLIKRFQEQENNLAETTFRLSIQDILLGPNAENDLRDLAERLRQAQIDAFNVGDIQKGDQLGEQLAIIETELKLQGTKNQLSKEEIEQNKVKLEQEKQRLEALRQGLTIQDDNLTRDNFNANIQQERLQSVAETLEFIQGLTKSGTLLDFQVAIAELEAALDFAGIAGPERRKLVEDALKVEAQIRQRAARDAKREELKQIEELQKEAVKLQEAALDERLRLDKESIQRGQQVASEAAAQLKAAQEEINALLEGTPGTGEIGDLDERARLNRLRDVVESTLENVDAVKDAINSGEGLSVEASLNLQRIGEGFEQIATGLDGIDVEKIEAVRSNFDRFRKSLGLGLSDPLTQGGELTLFPGESVDSIIKPIQKSIQETVELIQQREAASAKERKTLEEKEKFDERVREVAKEFFKTGEIARQKEIDDQREINRLLEERILALQAIQNGQAGGQAPVNNAFGGTVGSDRIPAILNPNETVMTAQATRTFGPLLDFMNNQAPTNQVNFGDINVTVEGGAPTEQAQAVVSELQRRIRSNRWRN